MRSSLLLCSLALFPLAAACQRDPVLQGRITRFSSLHDFDVNGRHITFAPEARVFVRTGKDSAITATESSRIVVGESAIIFGTDSGRRHPVRATRVEITPTLAHPVEGSAIIESVVPGAVTEIRADGYRIRLGASTAAKYEKPLTGISDIQAGQALRYKGTLGPDGFVAADSIEVRKNEIPKSLQKLRANWEFDPTGTPADSRQSGTDKFFRGRDASYFPPHRDAAMQQRVDTVGAKLIPEYQKRLPHSDPARIAFRFYLVDAPKAQQAYTFPSGIILVPYQLVDQLHEDSQLAAVLADAMVYLIEEQPIPLPLTNGQLATTAAVDAAAVGIAGVGLGLGGLEIGVGVAAAKQMHRNQEQRARVSLALMQRAGYDVQEAPVVWWLLATKRGRRMDESEPPEHALLLYSLLAENQIQAQNVEP